MFAMEGGGAISSQFRFRKRYVGLLNQLTDGQEASHGPHIEKVCKL